MICKYLIGLTTILIYIIVIVVFVTDQGVDRMYAKLLTPMQLLLESIVLIIIVHASCTTVVTLTVTNL